MVVGSMDGLWCLCVLAEMAAVMCKIMMGMVMWNNSGSVRTPSSQKLCRCSGVVVFMMRIVMGNQGGREIILLVVVKAFGLLY